MNRWVIASWAAVAVLAAAVAWLFWERPPVEPASRELDVPFFPTPQEAVDLMLEVAEVTAEDVVYDLGCGDGRIVVTAAKRYGCRAVGIDIDPKCVEASLASVRAEGVEHLVRIERRDIFDVDLSEATVVALYLGPALNRRLIPQLETMRPGSRIVSHQFEIPGVKPERIVHYGPEDHVGTDIYLWRTPLEKVPSPRRAIEER